MVCKSNTLSIWSILGEVVGACSFSVGHGASTLKKVASVKMLHQASDIQKVTSYPLERRVHIIKFFYVSHLLPLKTSFVANHVVSVFLSLRFSGAAQ